MHEPLTPTTIVHGDPSAWAANNLAGDNLTARNTLPAATFW